MFQYFYRKPTIRAIASSIAWLPVLLIGWYFIGLGLYFGNGGGIGGFGEAPADPESWVNIANWVLLVAFLAADIAIGVATYRRRSRLPRTED